MLSLLHIENIAVIEQADIELESGLTVLSGETGAGKSIIIDAIGALLGARVSRDLVRTGAEKGFVSAVFIHLSDGLTEALSALELTGEEPDTLHIQRQITADGKSTCRINMKPVAASVLKGLAPYLIDIHGQHDGQKLLDERYHIDFLDSFAGDAALQEAYLPHYQRLVSLKREITELETGEQERLQRVDMLTFHKEEIEQAALMPGEEEKLQQRKAFYDHAGKVSGALEAARVLLDGADDDGGICALLDRTGETLGTLGELAESYAALAEKAQEVRYLAADLRDEVASQAASCEFSPAEQEQLEARLDEIYRLKQKYGESVSAILDYGARITAELESLQTADTRRETLREDYRAELQQAKQAASALSDARQTAAKKLETAIVRELADLDMQRVRLRVGVQTGSKLTPHGYDTVAFEISVNPGEALRPLSKVASGGELSRIMLAMKNVLTEGEDVGMLIFDEIDTGVSGLAAQKIARKLAQIARHKQTLCVTHLPQIAAMGDHHLLIAKSVRGDRSYTDVSPMTVAARIDEVARMISGDTLTEKSRSSAEELLQAAAQYRNTDGGTLAGEGRDP